MPVWLELIVVLPNWYVLKVFLISFFSFGSAKATMITRVSSILVIVACRISTACFL